MEYVKICGLRKYEHVQLCIDHGADAVGFIYNIPSSPRNIEKNELKSLLRKIKDKILTVIVIKPSNVIELEEIMQDIEVSYYQIHIAFDIQELKKLSEMNKKKLILALKVNQANKKSIIKQINEYGNQFYGFLIDNSEGHGNEMDIEIVKEILNKTEGKRVIIAGGIKNNNVENIISVLRPHGIDASSSLESEKGVKNHSKIIEFLDNIKDIKNKLGE